MSCEMEFGGLDDMIKACEKLAYPGDIEKVDKKILKECAKKAQSKVSSKMKRSKDVSTSGRKGSRTFTHSADSVPVSGVKKKNNRLYVIVGWDKGDNSPYFYTKFLEWGTSKMAPYPVFLPATKETNKDLQAVGLKEYEKLLKFLER